MLSLSFDHCIDNITQGRKTQVNLGSFLQSCTSSLSLTLSFRTSQINKIKFSSFDSLFTSLIFFSSFNVNSKYRMTSRRVFIHGSFSCHSLSCSMIHICFNFRNGLYNASSQIFNKDSAIFIFFNFK
jgi:hypothetical protein